MTTICLCIDLLLVVKHSVSHGIYPPTQRNGYFPTEQELHEGDEMPHILSEYTTASRLFLAVSLVFVSLFYIEYGVFLSSETIDS